jgi:hypothetical protein
MQQSTLQRSVTTVASDPVRKMFRYYLLCLGSVLALLIGSFFLPEPLRDELTWSKSPPVFTFINAHSFLPIVFIPIVFILFPAIFLWPFTNILGSRRWKNLDRARQQAVQNRLSNRSTAPFLLPEVFTPLPSTLSLSLRRNWRATCVAGFIYALLIGLMLSTYISGWQINMQYLIQQGEVSGWTLLGSIFYGLSFCLYVLPAITAFIFTPHQQVIATPDGLICHRGLRFSSIPWSEACLFAVIAERQGVFVYELASTTSIIRWSSKPAGNYGDTFPAATVGIAPLSLVQAASSTEEYQWQTRLLTAMVAAGTNLPLYDLR